ncbi:MAG: MarC family protein, partial [Rikenellaceae bacterium]
GLQKGAFLNLDKGTRIEDIIAVPIAVPMIAGPATITAVVTMPSIYGQFTTLIAVTVAILLNLIIMRNARHIAGVLVKHNIMLPMIRITGLIVAAIGTQMIFNGIHTFIQTTI